YLAHDDERQALAQQARAHVYAHHTYDHRVTRVEELLGG
ncbi:MAG: glycosyltransferase, partial [Anaerolineae bacterium]|nr:glycosyltransferase [Anaerolineae bacterium]